jgi:glycine/serine hydroxymethyltransferase
MGAEQMKEIAAIINDTLTATAADNLDAHRESLKARVKALTAAFPLYK